MSTESLAVKHRPLRLSEIAGQETAKKILAGLLHPKNKQPLPGAFLIAGDTGLGKTSLARIIATTINCETHNACLKCASCKAMRSGSHGDYYEENAANARGIDDIRRILQIASYMPNYRYRVVVLDECLPPDAKIMIADGEFAAIGDIVNNPDQYSVVMAHNAETGAIEPKAIIGRSRTPVSQKTLVRVTFSDGSSQVCTSDHKIWSTTRGDWVEAGELAEGEKMLTAD